MQQLTFAGSDLVQDQQQEPEPGQTQFGIQLRAYQEARAREGFGFLMAGQSPLLEAATGTGKTAIMSDTIRRLLQDTNWRILWIVHRVELVRQAASAIQKATGVRVGWELAASGTDKAQYSDFTDRVVVASKDTIRTPGRIKRLKQFPGFNVIFTDEAHHSPGESYQTVYNAWPQALLYGATATVDRLDKQNLARFNARIEPYTILDGLRDSWLVPIRAKRVRVTSIDISQVGTVAGDLNQGQLDAVVAAEESLHGIAQGLLKYAVGPTIVFATGVESAERLSEILNRYRDGAAMCVHGGTPGQVRKDIFKDFGDRFQFLVNVGVATEGTDLPVARTVGMVRLTESRSLFAQMLGRVLRPLPGIDTASIDYDLALGPDQVRKLWISASQKPYALVLDFVGNTGRHAVVTAGDVLGLGNEKVKERVKFQIEQEQDQDTTIDVFQALEREQAKEVSNEQKRAKQQERKAAQRAQILATVTTEVQDQALIGMGGMPDGVTDQETDQVLGLSQPATVGQVDEMARLGIVVPKGCDRRKARFMITEARVKAGRATGPQLDLIRKHRPELVTNILSKADAQRIIGKLIYGWKGKRNGFSIRRN